MAVNIKSRARYTNINTVRFARVDETRVAIRIRFVREIAANASRAFSSNKREEPRGRQPARRTWFTCARVWLIRVSGEPDNRQPARSCFLGLNRSKMVRVKRVCVYVTRARFAQHTMNFRVMKVKWKFSVITMILSNGPIVTRSSNRRLNSHARLVETLHARI